MKFYVCYAGTWIPFKIRWYQSDSNFCKDWKCWGEFAYIYWQCTVMYCDNFIFCGSYIIIGFVNSFIYEHLHLSCFLGIDPFWWDFTRSWRNYPFPWKFGYWSSTREGKFLFKNLFCGFLLQYHDKIRLVLVGLYVLEIYSLQLYLLIYCGCAILL